ncbi:MAG: hypothetical protein NUV69_03180 [Candidatus Curtissbacteria bacterium]|nr:hypothetical protein [Candidatus Curtissbacteria bacterium]
MPSTVINNDNLLLRHLARPAMVKFGKQLGSEFDLPFQLRTRINRHAEVSVPLTVSLTTQNPRKEERELLAALDRMGFRGRNNLLKAYQSGEIGRKIVESHR